MLDLTETKFHHHDYILPKLIELLREISPPRVFDFGCGEGTASATIASNGYEVTGVDLSEKSILVGRTRHNSIKLEVANGEDDLAARFGRWPCVVSIEVVEHVYDPYLYARTVYNLLEDGGTAIITTPYHGYLKNLLIAASGKWDSHHTVLWRGGHIKFWSMDTLSKLLAESGFTDIHFHRVGRIPALAKSMIAVAKRPADSSA